jgi:hypothetical protein
MKKKLPDYDELRPHYDFDYDKMKPNRFAGEKKVYKHTTVILSRRRRVAAERRSAAGRSKDPLPSGG